jgi:hypothetical protein
MADENNAGVATLVPPAAVAASDGVQRTGEARTGVSGEAASANKGVVKADEASVTKPPVRGALRIDPSLSCPTITAGSDFSIFVVIQNPFDVAVTINRVQSHIPIELVDINGYERYGRLRGTGSGATSWMGKTRDLIANWFNDLLGRWAYRSGVAFAVNVPTRDIELSESDVNGVKQVHAFGGRTEVVLPQGMSKESVAGELKKFAGIGPVVLQPNDSVVHQFVLRTRNWLFFTPLTHTFQIQVCFATDSIQHNQTVPFQLNIRSTILAMCIGAVAGALVGAGLKSLSAAGSGATQPAWRAMTVAALAAFAVVVAFARKSNAQSFLSVEDFWGGALIGFSVGFFGFDQFANLFSPGSAAAAAPHK